MSKVADVLRVIEDRHVTGVENGLRDYHAAREAVSKARCRDPYKKRDEIAHALHAYKVRVTLGPVMDVMITAYPDGTGYYTVL